MLLQDRRTEQLALALVRVLVRVRVLVLVLVRVRVALLVPLTPHEGLWSD